ncbi:hypothetical protein F4775DRAFT_545606 [Biscogniauxia sp. FL1348]|nr:hypothetical protein F4775DRAFT_545606 [Biscogniauxia sp. FL1348]
MSALSKSPLALEVPQRSNGGHPHGLYAHDPRSSSTQSLVPSLPDYEEVERRTLLVVYIHGFMGNDTSFQSFPAHVHKYLKLALSDTHVIHSKIYPRYKTYKAIEVARDNFSRWLAPHESPKTDVVLVGHSMGGLLAADVVLMPSQDQYRLRYFRHRILGTVNLDAPLLGLHPGIIVSGISSLFRKTEPPKPPGGPSSQAEQSQAPSSITSPNSSVYSDPSTLSDISPSYPIPLGQVGPAATTFDPNFNPSFPNDIHLQDRGWWKNVVHFVKKHNSEGLIDAASNHIMSHLEFGSCLMDLSCLKNRYENVRKLEDIDDMKHYGFPHVPPQVRFIQYYTVCHGYPKKPKQGSPRPNTSTPSVQNDTSQKASNPRISIESHENDVKHVDPLHAIPKEDSAHSDISDEDQPGLELLDPTPIPEDDGPHEQATQIQEEEQSSDIKSPSVDITKIVRGDKDSEMADAPLVNAASSQAQPSPVDADTTAELTDAVSTLGIDLPTIPDLPPKPEMPNLEQYVDKDARKLAEKEAKRAQKTYEQVVKNRDKALKERQKIIDKRKKKIAQENEKREKEAQKKRQKEQAAAAAEAAASSSSSTAVEVAEMPTPTREDATPTAEVEIDQPSSTVAEKAPRESLDEFRPMSSPEQRVHDGHSPQNNLRSPPAPATPAKQKKDRKFCNLPHKINGQVDPKWVKIFMKDTDEVGAHTGLFFDGEHYEKLVGDMGDTIVRWVQEDMTKRAIMEMG